MSITIVESQEHTNFMSFWEPIVETVLNGVSDLTATSYGPTIQEFLSWWFEYGETNPVIATTAYRKYLVDREYKPATVNKKLSAVRKLFETAAVLGIGREKWPFSFEVATAIKAIKNVPQHGNLYGTRLAGQQLRELVYSPDAATLLGRRDRAVLALLIGCGLRRSEVVNLTWQHIKFDGTKNLWIITDMVGKHGRVRSVPIPTWVYELVMEYSERGKDSDRIIVSYDRHGNPRGKITAQSIYRIVTDYSEKLGYGVAPHDLRRSNALYLRNQGVSIEDIQAELGHSDPSISSKYIGKEGNMERLAEAWDGFEDE